MPLVLVQFLDQISPPRRIDPSIYYNSAECILFHGLEQGKKMEVREWPQDKNSRIAREHHVTSPSRMLEIIAINGSMADCSMLKFSIWFDSFYPKLGRTISSVYPQQTRYPHSSDCSGLSRKHQKWALIFRDTVEYGTNRRG